MQLIQQHHAFKFLTAQVGFGFCLSLYNLKISWIAMQVEKNSTEIQKGERFVIWLVVVLRIYVALATFQPYRDTRFAVLIKYVRF